MEQLCYGCMEKTQPGQPCPHCGWEENRRNESHQLPTGAVLAGRYVIGRCLGQGGFGITYIGWDRSLEETVAIKEYFPSGQVSRNHSRSAVVECTAGEQTFQEGRTRFLREARTLAKLRQQRNIVQVLGFFEENNTAYIVMEYLRGETLQSYIRNRGGRLTAAETFTILRPVLKALHQVHGAGMIHRDISPDNIMLQDDGTVKLLDFGTARDLDASGGQLTHSTQAVLKYGFAPAEQYAAGRSIDCRADEYALCSTVWYCLTGQVPPDALQRLMDGTPMDWASIPGLAPHQIQALARATAVRAEDRYPDLNALEQALFGGPGAIPGPEPVRPAPPKPAPVAEDFPQTKPIPREKPKKKGKWLLPLAICLVLALIVGGFLLLNRGIPVEDAGEAEDFLACFYNEEGADFLSREYHFRRKQDGTMTWSYPGKRLQDNYHLDLKQDLMYKTGKDRPDIYQVTAEKLADFADSEYSEDLEALGVEIPDTLRSGGLVKTNAAGAVTAVAFRGDTWLLAAEGTDNPTLVAAIFRVLVEEHTAAVGPEGTGVQAATPKETRPENTAWKKNIMMSDVPQDNMFTVFGRDLDRFQVRRIVFLDCQIPETPGEAWYVPQDQDGSLPVDDYWDISEAQDRSVLAGIIRREEWVVDLYIGGDGGVRAPENCEGLFFYYFGLEEISGIEHFHVTADVTDMGYMFTGCESLKALDLSGFDTSGVTSMEGMFLSCKALENLELGVWETDSVEKYEDFLSGETYKGEPWEKLFQ